MRVVRGGWRAVKASCAGRAGRVNHPSISIHPIHLTRQQQLVGGRDGAQLAQQAAVHVLQAVALVHHDVLPLVGGQELGVRQHDLVGGDDDGEGACHARGGRAQPPGPQGRPLLLGAMVKDGADRGRPPLHLGHPVGKGGQGADYQEGAVHALGLEVRQEPDRLDRLAQAHLVGQDAVEPVLVERDQPLDALELVVPQLALDEGQELL